MTGQHSIIEFLSDPTTYGVVSVEKIQTHISYIFLAGSKAYKLKREIKLPYLDFSTLEGRGKACENEIKINKRTAPMIYIDVKPITRDPNGLYSIGGDDKIVDWVVEMTRFENDNLLSQCAKNGFLDVNLMEILAKEIYSFHSKAKIYKEPGAGDIAAILQNNLECFSTFGAGIFTEQQIKEAVTGSERILAGISRLLHQRKRNGKVRHCHGDLHLANIVLIDGKPILFDAIEFDDALATIDVIYDLSFLVMDLAFQGLVVEANILLNRYITLSLDFEGLAPLPLFLFMRSSIRAHVAALNKDRIKAKNYMGFALNCLKQISPKLIAIGGLSGSGKSSLARLIAPNLTPLPGAILLRSDIIRKQLLGIDQYAKLTEQAYSPEITRKTYDEIYKRATIALKAGYSVIADAVFSAPDERQAIQNVGIHTGMQFKGIWLETDPTIASARILNRENDASDATPDVLNRQLDYDVGIMNWSAFDSSMSLERLSQEIFKRIQINDD
jgi:uncharacterized protein